jgi:hypothetical protein
MDFHKLYTCIDINRRSGINQVPEPREIGLIIFTALLIVLPKRNQCREVYRVEKT